MPFDGQSFDTDSVLRLLIVGRERVQRGWCQGAYRIGESVCLVEGVRDPAFEPKYWHIAYDYLKRALPAPWWTRSGYNDAEGRTQAEVIAVYDRAIDLRRADLLQEVG